MITIVDYGVGNLFSLRCSFGAVGENAAVTGDADAIWQADKIVLPGVGAFGDAALKLRDKGLIQVLTDKAKRGTPFLGICLGEQLLFDRSLEYGEHAGLGLIPGTVRPMAGVIPADYKIPHIGWNGLRFVRHDCPLFRGIEENECVYFVHSFYAADCDEALVAYAEYGAHLTAAVEKDNVYGCQFHPEKSGQVGLRILKNFCDL